MERAVIRGGMEAMHRKVKGLLSLVLTFAMVTASVAPVSADELSGKEQQPRRGTADCGDRGNTDRDRAWLERSRRQKPRLKSKV